MIARACLVLVPLLLVSAGVWLLCGLPAALISIGGLSWLDLTIGMICDRIAGSKAK